MPAQGSLARGLDHHKILILPADRHGKVPFGYRGREPSSIGFCYVAVDRDTVDNCNLTITPMQCTKDIHESSGSVPTVIRSLPSRTSTTVRSAGVSVRRRTEPKPVKPSYNRWWVHLLDEADHAIIIDSRGFEAKAEARRFYSGAVRVYGDHRIMFSSKKLAQFKRKLAPPNVSLTAVAL